MYSQHLRFSRLCLGFILLAFAACSSDEAVVPEPPGPNATSLLRTAWTRFAQDNYTDALDYFDQALAVEPDSFEAHLGRGWSLLKSSPDIVSLADARAAFDQALLTDAANRDALAGRAAANLSLGGAGLENAVADAEDVLQQDSSYEFQHDTAFNAAALHVVRAQAQASQDDFAAALLALDAIYVSGIDAENPQTWVVQGLVQNSFEAAVLAHLDRVGVLSSRGLI